MDLKISEMTPYTSIEDNDLFVIVDDANTETKKMTGATFKSMFAVVGEDNEFTVGQTINGTLTVTNTFTHTGAFNMTGDMDITGDIEVDNILLNGQAAAPIFTLTDAATITPDFDNSSIQTVTLAGNRIIANPTNMQDGGTYVIIIKQDATGSRTVTWNSAYKWPTGTAPTLSTTANAVDILSFVCDGTNMYGVVSNDFS